MKKRRLPRNGKRRFYLGYSAHRITNVGAGLLAIAVCQAQYVLADPPQSRASPLPQGGVAWRKAMLCAQ
ncbi:hypothetical protein FIV37_08355 [Pseudomonas gessardii]|nr:hypothetical protein [Pseudomonas gessardii]